MTEQAQSQSLAPFFVIWTSQAFSLLGSQLVQFALVWYLTTSTGSATVLAFASLVAIAGPVSDAVGVRPWFVIGGLVTAVVNGGAFFVPAIMQIENKTCLFPKEA